MGMRLNVAFAIGDPNDYTDMAVVYLHNGGEMLLQAEETIRRWMEDYNRLPRDLRFNDSTHLAARFLAYHTAADFWRNGVGVGIVPNATIFADYLVRIYCNDEHSITVEYRPVVNGEEGEIEHTQEHTAGEYSAPF